MGQAHDSDAPMQADTKDLCGGPCFFVTAVDRLEWQSIAEHIVSTLHRYQPKLAQDIDVTLPDDVNGGLFVNDVMTGGAAEEAGLQPGDLIIRVRDTKNEESALQSMLCVMESVSSDSGIGGR